MEANQNLSSWSSIKTRLSQQPDLSAESYATITIIRRSRLKISEMLKTSLLYEVGDNGCFAYTPSAIFTSKWEEKKTPLDRR